MAHQVHIDLDHRFAVGNAALRESMCEELERCLDVLVDMKLLPHMEHTVFGAREKTRRLLSHFGAVDGGIRDAGNLVYCRVLEIWKLREVPAMIPHISSLTSLKSGGNAIETMLGIAWISKNLPNFTVFQAEADKMSTWSIDLHLEAPHAWQIILGAREMALLSEEWIFRLIHAYEQLVSICPVLSSCRCSSQYTGDMVQHQMWHYEAIRLKFVDGKHFINCGAMPAPSSQWHLAYREEQYNYLVAMGVQEIVPARIAICDSSDVTPPTPLKQIRRRWGRYSVRSSAH